MKHLPAILLVGSAIAAAAAAPVQARAQMPAQAKPSAAASATATNDDVFDRARRLMAAGQEDSGRAVVQSELSAADSGSARYVEALYWRAVLAKTAADAERDLRTIVIDYPLSAQSDDALMRLAQLEMTRGENDRAMGHLQRVVREHSRSASRPRASFWMARMLFDKGDTTGACARLADAAATTPAGQAELRNQIDYLSSRCIGVDTGSAPAAAVGARPTAGKPGVAQPGAAKSATGQPGTVKPAAGQSPAVKPAVGQSPVARPAVAKPAGQPAVAKAVHGPEFTVQVAAFSSLESAEKIRQRLSELGYDARIAGSAAPYRVRVGRYPTREAADSIAARMKTQHVDGYVTQAEPRR